MPCCPRCVKADRKACDERQSEDGALKRDLTPRHDAAPISQRKPHPNIGFQCVERMI